MSGSGGLLLYANMVVASDRLSASRHPPHVVHVVDVEVVGGARRDQSLECGWAPCRDLQRVEATPRVAEHAHVAVTPRLARGPLDGLDAVALFLFQVLIAQDTIGIAAAAHVDANAGVAVAREVRMVDPVAASRDVAFAVGDVLDNCGHGMLLGILGHPHARSHPRAIRQRDPDVLDRPHGTGQRRYVTHGFSSNGSRSAASRYLTLSSWVLSAPMSSSART